MVIKVLVTGIEGQLARALAERAAGRADLDLVCVGRPDLDLEKPETIAPALRAVSADVVINAAAYTAVDQAEVEFDRAMRINDSAVGVVARAARLMEAKLIHVSTDYVYDGTKPSPYVETDVVAPKSVYGRSKLAGETRVLAEHPQAVVLRTAWVYSPFGRNFVKTMLELARTREQLSVVDDQYGCPTSALDIADALIALIDHWRSDPLRGAGETYHCAGAGQATWCAFARHVFATSGALGGPCPEVVAINSGDWPTKVLRPKNSRLDCSKFRQDFAWAMPDWQRSARVVVRRLLGDMRLVSLGETV